MSQKVRAAVSAIARGEMIIVADDENRENEGDFIMAASKITKEAVNFMSIYGRGLICVALDPQLARNFKLFSMVKGGDDKFRTNFTVTVDYRHGTSTGISMEDRAKTIRALSDKTTLAEDFLRPGHVFPIISKPGGLKERRGHTEAAVELARLAGQPPAGAICEIIREDGEMARNSDLAAVAKRFGLQFITIEELACFDAL